MIAASKGYRFVCVTDSRCNLATRRLMEALGSQVHIITEPDPIGGLLGARIDYVRALCASDDRYVWLNQYTNPNNWQAHYRRTAPAIARQFPELDVLFVGAGTTGTLMGCARFFQRVAPAGADRRGRQRRLGDLRRPAGPPDDPRPGHERAARRCSTSPTSTTWSTSRRPTPSAPATGWPAAGSCSAAPPARWSAARPTGWRSTTAAT